MSSEVFLPNLQLCSTVDSESHMIQSRPFLGESLPLVGVVAVKDDSESPLIVGQHHPRSTNMWRLHQQRHIENLLIPSHAGIEIGHREGDMMERGVHGLCHDENVADNEIIAPSATELSIISVWVSEEVKCARFASREFEETLTSSSVRRPRDVMTTFAALYDDRVSER